MIFRNIAKDTLIYGGGDLAGKLIAFLTFPLIAAALSPSDFGVLELITTTTVLLGLFVGCGLNNAVGRFYWDQAIVDEDQRPAIVSVGLGLQVIFGLSILLLILPFTPFTLEALKEKNINLEWAGLLAALLIIPLGQWLQYIQDVTRLHLAPWKFLTISFFTKVGVALLCLFVVVYLNRGINGYLVAQAIVLCFVLPLGLWIIRKDLTLKLTYSWVKELVSFGHPFIFVGIAYWIFGSLDRWMLATMVSVEEAGIYSVSFRFSMIVLFVSMAFGQAWSPRSIKIKAEHPQEYRKIYGHVLLILFYIMLALGGGLALFSGEIITLIMPENYFPAAMPLAILCFSVVLQSTQQITAVGISLERKTYLFARLTWLAAAINILLNLSLIPILGATGAALATLISYIFLTSGYLYYTQRLHPIIVPWRSLIFLTSLGVVIAIISIMLINLGALNWSIIAVKLFVYFAYLALGFSILPWKEFIHGKS